MLPLFFNLAYQHHSLVAVYARSCSAYRISKLPNDDTGSSGSISFFLSFSPAYQVLELYVST